MKFKYEVIYRDDENAWKDKTKLVNAKNAAEAEKKFKKNNPELHFVCVIDPQECKVF